MSSFMRYLLLIAVAVASLTVHAQPPKAAEKLSAVEITPSNASEPQRDRNYPKNDLRSADSADLPASSKKLAGPAALKLQILLDRASFSSGEIDGAMGKKTAKALAGFQAARKLPETGKLDADTQQALMAESQQVLTDYTVTNEDVSGPFVSIPEKMEDKAKLSALGYQTALEGLAEKFHASPGLLKKLNPGKSFDRAGEVLLVPNVLTTAAQANGAKAQPVKKASRIVVTKADSTVRALAENGSILAQFPASMGSQHDPLPIGKWKIKSVVKNPTFHYNPDLFWDADSKDPKVKVPPGPNNPVGVVWIDLSKEHYGIHGTPEPAKISDTQSHGCIRLTNWDVHRLAQLVSPGMLAELKE